jgi:hypothetical protein
MGAYIVIMVLVIVSDIYLFGVNLYSLRNVGCLVTATIAWWVQSRFLWTTEYFITFISILFWLTILVAHLSSDNSWSQGYWVFISIYLHQMYLQVFFNCSFVHSQYIQPALTIVVTGIIINSSDALRVSPYLILGYCIGLTITL